MNRWMVVVTLVAIAGCRDDSNGNTDAGGSDAYVNALGTVCTGTGRGTCPFGFNCISVDVSTTRYCAQECTGYADTACAVGYTGPGFAACFIETGGAGSGPDRCGIVCNDPAGGMDWCDATTCNGTCPTGLTCGPPPQGVGYAACI